MAKKRKKAPAPIALLWTKRDQLRFTQAVERLCGLVNDLERIAGELSRRPGRKRLGPAEHISGQGGETPPANAVPG